MTDKALLKDRLIDALRFSAEKAWPGWACWAEEYGDDLCPPYDPDAPLEWDWSYQIEEIAVAEIKALIAELEAL